MNAIANKVKNAIVVSERRQPLFDWFGASAVAKIVPVCEYIEDFLNKSQKFLCFCHHRDMMDGVQEMLNKNRISHIRIDGSTLPKLRQEACDEFQKNDNCKVALLSITASAVGLNLTAATAVIFAETYWNPGLLAQVFVSYLCVKNIFVFNIFLFSVTLG